MTSPQRAARPRRSGLWTALALAAALLPSVPAAAAGMDCAKAASPVEKTICADPALREADRAMADAFSDLLSALPEKDKADARAAQRTWLAARNACPDAACLKARHAERLAALEKARAAARQAWLDERARLRAVLGWPDACEQSYQEMVSPQGLDLPVLSPGVERFALDGERALYCVQCDQAAYQATYVAVLQDAPGKAGTLLRFPTVADSDAPSRPEPQEDLVGDLDFDAKAGTLTVLTKGRGLADCGVRAVYAFPPEGGVAVREIRVRQCPRAPKGYVPPERWPLLRTR